MSVMEVTGCSAYPALVNTLNQLFTPHNHETDSCTSAVKAFVMCWKRRIDESKLFFQLLKEHDYTVVHEGAGVYVITKSLP